MQNIIDLALSLGFSHVSPLDPGTLRFLPEVRAMCAADKCRSYGKNWSCPPNCPSLEEMTRRAKGYHRGILVQSVGQMEDDFDFETMMETEQLQKDRFYALAAAIKQDYPGCLPMSAGACTLCKHCACPENPCRHPETLYPSMEACGLMVSDTCRENGMDYYYGKGTITFTSCILID